MFGNKKSKIPNAQCTAIWIDSVGTISIRIFTILGKKEDKIKIDFGNNEQYIIKEKDIRAKRAVIYQKNDGNIIVQNPNTWKNINLKAKGIKELRFNLQNLGIQESKAAQFRWTLPPDTITKLSPLFKLLMICIVVGVIGWSALKFGTYVLDVVMKSRTLPCADVLPKLAAPIGANITAALSLIFLKKYK